MISSLCGLRIVLLCAGAFGLALAGAAQEAGPRGAVDARRPNVLMVMLDDVGIYETAAYGGSDPARTPTIDALAGSGVVFERCWSMPLCSPTRASLMTGKYPFRHGVGRSISRQSKFGLPSSGANYLPALLPSSYAKALIGKWHISADDPAAPVFGGPASPQNIQFDHHDGIMFNLNESLGESYFNWPKVRNGVELGLEQRYMTTDQVDSAVAWINAQRGPWFCVLSLSAPHEPFHVPPAALAALPPNPTDRERYLAMIEAIDAELGRLLDSMRRDALDSTVVFVFGDNGAPTEVLSPELAGQVGKGSVSESGVRVPLIVSGRGMPRARRIPQLVGLIDLWATVLDLTGSDHVLSSDEVHSSSLLPLIHGVGPGPTRRKGWQYTEHFRPLGEFTAKKKTLWKRAVSDGRWKLLEDNGKRQLYDLESDPLEAQNLFGQSQVAAIQAALVAALHQRFGGKSPLSKNVGGGGVGSGGG